jgi:hypothetical protein
MAYWIFSHLIAALGVIVVVYLFTRLKTHPEPALTEQPVASKLEEPQYGPPKSRFGLTIAALALYGLIALAFGLMSLFFLYGIVVIVFRNAFGIELPFGRFS